VPARPAGDGGLTGTGTTLDQPVPAPPGDADPPAPPDASPIPLRRLVLELALPPEDAPRLGQLLRGTGRRRAVPVRFFWYDTPDFDLAADGVSLAERQQGRETVWRLETILPEAGPPHPVLAEAADAASLGAGLPARLARVAGFEGRSRTLPGPDGVELTLLSGTLSADVVSFPCCRAVLAGPAGAVATQAGLLAGRVALHVPRLSLAAEALAMAGHSVPGRRRAAPALSPGQKVGEAFAFLVARLAEAMLHEAARAGPADAEPVHQMRVAVRRLRSAFGLFGRAVRCPELTACKAGLKALAKVLGPARDWDVFVAGTGRAVAAEFPEDRALRRLLVAAERRRLEAYAALQQSLASAEFRQLGIALAVLAAARPWETMLQAPSSVGAEEAAARQAEILAVPLAGFAARALQRQLRPLREPGADIGALPPGALHGLRLHGKRLRYACEFFGPLFSGRAARRFIRRLTVLQERLGHLNDGAVAAGLMAELGAARGAAGGVVRGFVAARAAGARERIGRAWRKFHRLDPFWGGR
jgi:CHAD domain-containing protein